MTKAFELVAYQGPPLSISELASLLAKYTPRAMFFRHAVATQETPLNCIAFYQGKYPLGGSPLGSSTSSSYGRSALADDMRAAARDQAANAIEAALDLVHSRAPAPTSAAGSDCAGLVRALIELRGKAFLLGNGLRVDGVDVEDFTLGVFHEASPLPLYAPQRPERAIPFDPSFHRMGLSDPRWPS